MAPDFTPIFPYSIGIKQPSWSPITASTFGFSIQPSSIIGKAPPGVSSPGWKNILTVPLSLSLFSFNIIQAPSAIAVCPSCPQACIFPFVEAKESPVFSTTGSASLSALIAIHLPFCSPSI